MDGTLVNRVIQPTYRFDIVDPQSRLVTVAVDAISGDADVSDGRKKRKKGKRGKRGKIHCDDLDSDLDSDTDADSDTAKGSD